jgi:hypothetical protein
MAMALHYPKVDWLLVSGHYDLYHVLVQSRFFFTSRATSFIKTEYHDYLLIGFLARNHRSYVLNHNY